MAVAEVLQLLVNLVLLTEVAVAEVLKETKAQNGILAVQAEKVLL